MIRLFRNLCSTLLLAITLASHCFAQLQVSIGLQGGIDIANAAVEHASFQTSSRTGLRAGGIVEVGIIGPFFVQIEPTYCQKGAAMSSGNTIDIDAQYGTTATFNYIEVPVLLKIKLLSDELKPYVFTGFNPAFRLSASLDSEIGGETMSQDFTSEVEKREFAWDFGAGIAYEVTDGITLGTDVRYSLGLTDVDNSPILSWRSRDIKIMAGLLFAL